MIGSSQDFHFHPLSYFHQLTLYSLLRAQVPFEVRIFAGGDKFLDCSFGPDIQSWTHVSLLNPDLGDKENFFNFALKISKNLIKVLPLIYSTEDEDAVSVGLNYLELQLFKLERELSSNGMEISEMHIVCLVPALFTVLSCFSFHQFPTLREIFLRESQKTAFLKAKAIIQDYKRSRVDLIPHWQLKRLQHLAQASQSVWHEHTHR